VANKAWAGSNTNNASDPNAWVPNGVPAAGDALFMAGGGMNVAGGDLAGDTINLEGNGAAATFNVYAPNTGLDLIERGYSGAVTFNIQDGTNWVGGVTTYPQYGLVVNGPGEWDNTSSGINGGAKINANIGGTGKVNIYDAHAEGVVEFGGAVGSGQAVSVDGYAEYGGQFGDIQIDNPATYEAPTSLGFGEVHLQGMQADSYSYDGSKLTLYDGGNAVDTLDLTIVQNKSGGPSGVGQDFGVSQSADGVVIHTDDKSYKDDGKLLPRVPDPTEGAYQYLPPGGPLGPVTPINNHTLLGGAGAYSVHSTGLTFIASATDSVGFVPDSSFDLTIQPQGGVVSLAGSWNLSIANAGVFEALDNTPGDGHNMLVAGSPVSTVLAELQPTDNMFLQGVTQADIDAAFKNMRVQSAPGGASNLEILTMPRAGGSALTVLIPASIHGPAAATAAQFHGF
jgi:hypothetical protein